MPRRLTATSPLLIIVIVLLCLALMALGVWIMRPSKPPHGFDSSPTVITTYPATTETAATAPATAQTPTPATPASASAQMLLGNPSDATPDPENRDNYLMMKPYFATAYNNSAGEPKWVSWRLWAADLGTAPRKRVFDPDDTLPNGFLHVQTSMYVGSGFDRGHMCDHADRASTIESSYATFVMTNIVPQAPNNNQKAWARLEDYCRELARAGDRLYITSGPLGRGGVGKNGPADTIANGRVVVPAETWKVIVVTHDIGRDDLANVDASDRVIAVGVPNDNDKVGEVWAGFRCSPASIEAKAGLHFFSALPPDVRAALDAKVDAEPIAPPRPFNRGGG